MKYKKLEPIREEPQFYDDIEKVLAKFFADEIYIPILKELTEKKIVLNDQDIILEALRSGKIRFWQGKFTGKFNASLSKELKKIGAKWDAKTSSWKMRIEYIPPDIQTAIRVSEDRFNRTVESIDVKLAGFISSEAALPLQLERLFQRTLWDIDSKLQETVKDITIVPKLTRAQNKKISTEYVKQLDKPIKDFSQTRTLELRKKIREAAMRGERYEGLIKTIQDDFGIAHRKAKFLARQETSLMMAKFKETRYRDGGVDEYQWMCVVGSPKHPVRPSHKACNKKFFRWDSDREVDENGKTVRGGQMKPGNAHDCNPGEDYNCRCTARPIARFT